MRRMKFDAWYLTDKGRRRDSNQDSCLINKNFGLFVVADGMGGHSGGEVASSIAVQTVEEVFQQNLNGKKTARELIQTAYSESSRKIFDVAALDRPELAGMGTTMVLGYLKNRNFYVGNVGDSRCYLFKKPHLWQITEDHSLMNEQIRAGLIKEDQIKNFVGRNVITRSVGYEREVNADIIEREVFPGETYLICSDGLSSMVGDQRISEILDQNPPDKAAKVCVEQALTNGGDDNVTVLVIHFYE